MKHVVMNWSVWRLEDDAYLRLLNTIGSSQKFTMLDFGVLILRIDADVSSMSARAAQLLHDQLSHEEVKA